MTWRALLARLWAVILQRLTPLPPDCVDCGMPLDAMPFFRSAVWTCIKMVITRRRLYRQIDGRCLECAHLWVESEKLEVESDKLRVQIAKAGIMSDVGNRIGLMLGGEGEAVRIENCFVQNDWVETVAEKTRRERARVADAQYRESREALDRADAYLQRAIKAHR